MNSSINPPGAAGMPEESTGTILQRGGEELLLSKANDRLAVRASSPEIDLTAKIPSQSNQQIPRTQLREFIVAPETLETTMQAARRLPEVAFVSHVYRLKKNLQVLVYLTDEITIQFGEQTEENTRKAIADEFALQLGKTVDGIPNTFVYQVTKQSTENPVKIANRLMGRSQVLTAEPNIIIRQEQHYRPKDSMYNQQWYLNNSGGDQMSATAHIFAEQAWDITKGVRSVIIAVADDGVDLNHPDFQGNGKIVFPRDLKEQDFTPLPTEPEENHGTACAGVAVAEENGTGIVGVAPGCALMPIRTTGYLDDDSVEQVFDWVIAKGAAVVSCSWGAAAVYFPLSLRQRAALTRAATTGRNGKGCVVVFAAGNANRPVSGTVNERGWASGVLQGSTEWLNGFTIHPDVIAVSASTSLAKKAAYSNWGTNISVCAPSNNAPPGMWFEQTGYTYTAPEVNSPLQGLGIFTTDRMGAAGYSTTNFTSDFGGTSSACPVVAGVAGLVLSANPDLTAQEVKRILQQTADKIVDSDADPQLGLRLGTYDANSFSQWFGYGKVNAFKAVQLAQQKRQPPTPQSVQKSNNNSLAIPDNAPQGVNSTITVSDRALIKDIQIKVNIEHAFLGDVEINLVSPTGQSVLLQSRTLGAATQLNAVYTVQTTPALKQLVNLSATGNWQLNVCDRVPTDVGTLKGWELTLSIG